jgi:hypothetical protein
MKLSSIVIPVNVTSIQDNAFADGVDKIYYEGTQQQWKKLKAGVKYSSIYYYSDCVHESGYWTYIGDEIVDQTSFTEHVANEATCTEKGLVETVCDYCGEVVDKTYTDKIDHDPDDDGVCKMCGKKVKG